MMRRGFFEFSGKIKHYHKQYIIYWRGVLIPEAGEAMDRRANILLVGDVLAQVQSPLRPSDALTAVLAARTGPAKDIRGGRCVS
jgi:hypothetical protein